MLRRARPLARASGSGIVVEQDEDAVGVAEKALILLNLQAGQRAAEFGKERPSEQLRQGQVVQLRKLCLQLLFAFARIRGADSEDVDQCAPGVPYGFQNLLETLAAVVFDDDAGAGGEVGLDVGIGPTEIACRDAQPALVKTAGQRLALDEEPYFEAGQQDLVEHPDGQFSLADGETPHVRLAVPTRVNPTHRCEILIIRLCSAQAEPATQSLVHGRVHRAACV